MHVCDQKKNQTTTKQKQNNVNKISQFIMLIIILIFPAHFDWLII